MSKIVNDIMRYEEGTLSDKQVTRFFGRLIKSGMCWKLQGCYGRSAQNFIDYGIIERDTGKIYWDRYDQVREEAGHDD